ncbi:MAG: efflux RND transporter periplasmic adaptor subunit [Wenzhouxiangella sp.]
MNTTRFGLMALAFLLFALLPFKAWALEVIVAPVSERPLSDPIESLGTLRANESADLTATITETISEIRFRDGQRVEAGQVLLTLTNREQLAELAAAEAELDEARQQFDRVQDLAARGQESRAVLDQRQRELNTAQARLQAVEARLSDRLITAPFNGVVGLRNVSVGSLLSPGTVVTTLVDDSVMKVDFTVPEVFLSHVQTGLSIEARTGAFADEVFNGQVTGLGNTVDPVTRAFRVRGEIANPDRKLKPGMLMSVTLASRERNGLTVPEEAILSRGRDHHVFVVSGDDTLTAERRAVRLGMRLPGHVEILDGLAAGERVVIHGGFRLSDGDSIEIRAEVDGDESLARILSGGR